MTVRSIAAVVGIDRLLADARRDLRRLTAEQAFAAIAEGWLLVDTRSERQRRDQGLIPDAIVIERNMLEWRLDPASESRIPIADSYDLPVIVICAEGYSSSLAAVSLQALGLHRATDVIDGVDGWRRAGLPLLPFAG